MNEAYRETPDADMNCIPGFPLRPVVYGRKPPCLAIPETVVAAILCLTFVFLASCSAPASETATPAAPKERVYDAKFMITPDISRNGADVELRISQDRPLLRELSMPFDARLIKDISGDGQVSIDNGRVCWLPPADGGKMHWFATIPHLRDGKSYDAYIGRDWAIFRAEDIIPPTSTRAMAGSTSRTTLVFELPDGWSAVTEYFRRSNAFNVTNSLRRFDRPSGWILLGKLGTRHETIAGIRVTVAAPVGQAVRRMDILALLNWTLPEIVRLLPAYPRRLTVISAGDPMWRGGLSAPRSFYIHADRPLISENGTSSVMHEAIHVGLGSGAVSGADWVIEGLAEYYGLEILRRSGTISERRYQDARSKLKKWGNDVKSLCVAASTGAVTARAVTLLAQLNDEISKKSKRKHDLDDVFREVAASTDKISFQWLRDVAAGLAGGQSEVLSDKSLNNCINQP